MNRVSIIGADPGRKGAIVALFISNKLELEYLKIEHISRAPVPFFQAVEQTIAKWTSEAPCVGCALEEPFALKKQGSMLSYGRYFGHLEIALNLALKGDVKLYYPSQWQPFVLNKFKGIQAKEVASFVFQKLFKLPDELREHDGVVDAACIAISHGIQMGIIDKKLVDWKEFAQLKGINYEPKRKSTRPRPSRSKRVEDNRHI